MCLAQRESATNWTEYRDWVRGKHVKSNSWKKLEKKFIAFFSNFHYRGLHIVVTFHLLQRMRCGVALSAGGGGGRMEMWKCHATPPQAHIHPAVSFFSFSLSFELDCACVGESRDSNDKRPPHRQCTRPRRSRTNHEDWVWSEWEEEKKGREEWEHGSGKKNEHNLRNLSAPFIPSQSTHEKMEIFSPAILQPMPPLSSDINFLFFSPFFVYFRSLPLIKLEKLLSFASEL